MCAACSCAVDMKTQPVSDMFSRRHIRTKCLPRKCIYILLIQKVLDYSVSVRHCSTIVLLAGWTAYLSISVQISRKTNQIRVDAHMEMQGCRNNSDLHASIPALVTGAAWWHWWQYWAYVVLRPLAWECNTLNQFWGGQVSSCNCLLHKWLMPPLSKTSEPEQKATHRWSLVFLNDVLRKGSQTKIRNIFHSTKPAFLISLYPLRLFTDSATFESLSRSPVVTLTCNVCWLSLTLSKTVNLLVGWKGQRHWELNMAQVGLVKGEDCLSPSENLLSFQ